MEKLRIIIQSTQNGNEEYIEFSTQLNLPIDNFLRSGCTVDIDTIINIDLPLGFPVDYAFKRIL